MSHADPPDGRQPPDDPWERMLVERMTPAIEKRAKALARAFDGLALVKEDDLRQQGYLGLVQAATVCALVELDGDRRAGPVEAFRLALRRWRPLAGGLAFVGFAWVVLSLSTLLLPVALYLVVRWSLFAQVVEVEGLPAFAALRRSSRLVRRRWIRVASLAGLGAAIALLSGPLLGALLIFLTDAPLATLNVVAGVVYALALPLVALVTSYLYFDVRARDELEPADERDELPAEITITPA